MKKVLVVFGTRPEAIKMCPLIIELKNTPGINTIVCVTGQHKQMLDQVLKTFNVIPEYDLSIMKERQTLFEITNNILIKLKTVLEFEKPDLLLVHGDTTTTFAASLACFYMHIPVGHVEAGLRTNNIYSPYPEEFNRRVVSIIASYHFAPTIKAKENLLQEGIDESKIFITGNTAIDALKTTINNQYTNEHLSWAKGSRLILLTSHRRENIGKPMENIFSAVRKIIEEYNDVKVIYPIHLNPIIKELAQEEFKNCDRIRLIEPLDVISFHNFIAASYLVLTDSGGIQEEAPSLGKPVLVLRDTTERPEGITSGTLKLVGTDSYNIYIETKRLLDDKDEYEKMAKATNPYGDGYASKKIANIIIEELK